MHAIPAQFIAYAHSHHELFLSILPFAQLSFHNALSERGKRQWHYDMSTKAEVLVPIRAPGRRAPLNHLAPRNCQHQRGH
ncbi:hypothetical protein PGT21_004407 [Puccinia graminis f. sp. tritici]|uniref:Uncharacterized protein n=1 Tax=Puccinia graminis f. sp. tritici TaxID=56615 RepID=A0A5B0RPH8_PUCGR|nr:hypothetical protein PGT21_004407 [Puccinia graminis f. sp. tritici]KAA1127680.1 hypothetical protein PGTUg99_003808 [Puccinia graminis f. sp. tritici]